MKKNISVTVALSTVLFFIPNYVANANTCPFGGSPNWQGQCDTTTENGESYSGPPMSQEEADRYTQENSIIVNDPEAPKIIQEPPVNNDESVDSSPPQISSGDHSGWMAVNPDGSPASDIIVCTIEVCGQTGENSWLDTAIKDGTLSPGVTLVLQTLQDPIEAANSINGVGNVSGYPESRYDFINNRWIMDGPDGSVYQIPLAYPGTDLGGNTNLPFCIENCPIIEAPEEILDQPIVEEIPDGNLSTTQTRNFVKKITTSKKNFSFKIKINKKNKVKFGKIWVIAQKNKIKNVWKFEINKKNKVFITLPIEYLEWNISINYKLKNNKKISKKVIIK